MLRAYYLSSRGLRYTASNMISSESNETKRSKEARFRVEEALGSCLLPSLQLIPANPAIGQEIWEVLSLLPYEVCYPHSCSWLAICKEAHYYFVFATLPLFFCYCNLGVKYPHIDWKATDWNSVRHGPGLIQSIKKIVA